MKAVAIAMLFAVVLAGSAFAGDDSRKEASSSNPGQFFVENGNSRGHKHKPPVELAGAYQLRSTKARTGEMVIPLEATLGQVEARLTFGPGSFATLYTKETWAAWGLVREMSWTLVIGRDGKVTARYPNHATYYYGPDYTIPSEEVDNTVGAHAEATGCPEYGTWPIFYGHFDGKYLDIASEQQGVCTGGNMWKDAFGVSEAMGPLHTDTLLSLEVIE
jgi:hypothetical protein